MANTGHNLGTARATRRGDARRANNAYGVRIPGWRPPLRADCGESPLLSQARARRPAYGEIHLRFGVDIAQTPLCQRIVGRTVKVFALS